MPFVTPGQNPDTWVGKDSITLTQVSDEIARSLGGTTRGKTYFLVDDTFGYTLGAAPYAEPFPEDLVCGDAPGARNLTDLASIPRFLWGVIASYGHQTMPALLHDTRCHIAADAKQMGFRFRRKTDEQFRQTLKAHSKMGVVTRWIMWSAVRTFGFAPLGATVILDGLWWWTHAALTVAAVTIPAPVVIAVGAISTVLTVGLMFVRSREIQWNGLPRDKPSDDEPKCALVAIGSQVGAAAVAILAVGPLFPVVAITILTNLGLAAANWMSFVIARIGRAFHLKLPAFGQTPVSGTTPRRQPEPPPRTTILPGV